MHYAPASLETNTKQKLNKKKNKQKEGKNYMIHTSFWSFYVYKFEFIYRINMFPIPIHKCQCNDTHSSRYGQEYNSE